MVSSALDGPARLTTEQSVRPGMAGASPALARLWQACGDVLAGSTARAGAVVTALPSRAAWAGEPSPGSGRAPRRATVHGSRALGAGGPVRTSGGCQFEVLVDVQK